MIVSPLSLIEFFLPGDPKPKLRARASAGNKVKGTKKRRIRMKTPVKTKIEQARLYTIMRKVAPEVPHLGPVRLSLGYTMPLPKSYSRKLHGGPHVKKPDIDNLVKLTMDAMTNAGFWVDDTQVVYLLATKRYQREAEAAGCWVTVEEL